MAQKMHCYENLSTLDPICSAGVQPKFQRWGCVILAICLALIVYTSGAWAMCATFDCSYIAQPQSAPPKKESIPPVGARGIESIPSDIPSGFMGDALPENGKTASLSKSSDCHWSNVCYRIEYKPGSLGWAAFAWQVVKDGAANWGEHTGVDLRAGKFRSLRVWAKGLLDGGAIPRIQFKSGGNVARQFAATNPASYTVASPFVQLTDKYAQYCLDLDHKDLSNIISPFTVVVDSTHNERSKNVAALLSDIYFSPEPCPNGSALVPDRQMAGTN